MDETRRTFADNLRRARKARGLSLRALAAQIDHAVTPQAIHRYETGQTWPSSSVLVALAHAVHVPVECLMSETACIAAPPPKPAKPPASRIGRVRAWAALWRRSAHNWRQLSRFNVRAYRRADEERRAWRARVTELEAAIERLRGAWVALGRCEDEFCPEQPEACSEYRDALDTAILAVIRTAGKER